MYAAFTGSVLLIAVFRSFLFFEVARRAGTRMHHRMARTVLHAPLSFFHTNPSGRVLNRFSKVRSPPNRVLHLPWLTCSHELYIRGLLKPHVRNAGVEAKTCKCAH